MCGFCCPSQAMAARPGRRPGPTNSWSWAAGLSRLQAMNHSQLILNSCLLHRRPPGKASPSTLVNIWCTALKGFWLRCRKMAGKYESACLFWICGLWKCAAPLLLLLWFHRSLRCTCRHALRSQTSCWIKAVKLDFWNRRLDHRSIFEPPSSTFIFNAKTTSTPYRLLVEQRASWVMEFSDGSFLTTLGLLNVCVPVISTPSLHLSLTHTHRHTHDGCDLRSPLVLSHLHSCMLIWSCWKVHKIILYGWL